MIILLNKLLPSPKYYFAIIISLALFFSFWKLSSNDLSEWDEAEYGTISFEMIHNGDYVNYSYAGTQDTRNGKPPLMIWLIIICYKLFGYNAFALRFTSAIASLIFFIFSFKLIALYKDKLFALIVCLVLLSCKSIVGFHVGRTGDTDALLVCFLTASTYFFLLYLDFGRRNAVFLFAIFIGLSFYTKGPAAFVLIPGLLLYIIISGKLKKTIRDIKVWLALMILFLIAGSWVFILLKKGNEFNAGTSWYGSHNALETLFSHDTFARLTDSNFEPDRKPDRAFFFSVLDIRFNIWNYFFYLSLLIGIINLLKYPMSFLKKMLEIENRFITLSFCMILPLSLLLTFAATKHDWYLAPLALYVSVIITVGITYISERYKWFYFIWISVLIINLCRQFVYVNSPRHEVSSFFLKNKNYFESASIVNVLNIPTQDFFLYLNWHAPRIEISEMNSKKYSKGSLIFFDSRLSKPQELPNIKLIDCTKTYCIASVN